MTIPPTVDEISPNEPFFETAYLLEMIHGDINTMDKFMGVLLDGFEKMITEANQQIQAGHTADASESLHRLLNTAGILQSTILIEKIRVAEQMANNEYGEPVPSLKEYWADVMPLLQLLAQKVRSWYNAYRAETQKLS